MDENKVYTIAVRLQGNKIQREELYDLIEGCINDDKADLRFTAVHINNNTSYENEPEFTNEDFKNYRGFIMRHPVFKEQIHIVESYGLFPTKLFQAIENQYPNVTVSFTACSDDWAASYSNDFQYAHRKIVVPNMVHWLTPFDSERVDSSTLHSIASFFQNNDLEGRILVCKIHKDDLPSEHPRKSVVYNPYNVRDEDLKIDKELIKKHFPNLKRPERKQPTSRKSMRTNINSESQHQTSSSLSQQPKKNGSIVMKILKWTFISIGAIIALFILWILSMVL